MVVDDWLFYSGRCCLTILLLLFRFRSLYLYLFCFFIPNFLFFSGYTHSIHIDENTWQNPYNTHTKRTHLRIRKKGHADCHAYRTLDPRRPVYDELSIHPPPRRNVAVPGEEVNQSGASLYAGKWKPSLTNPRLPCCVSFSAWTYIILTLFLTLGWRHTLTKKKADDNLCGTRLAY